MFALNPSNPDAARHFCTSAREVIATILDTQAPDVDVLAMIPDCDLTPGGQPTRRSKIRFCLQRARLASNVLEEFVESDLDNVVALFRVFNQGTHGSAGSFNLGQLGRIRKRVEEAILFLLRLIS